MGWWKIDPETGYPLKEGHSRLSRPPEFVLLNAVPGVDDDEEAHFLGDSPWDMVADAVNQIKRLHISEQRLSADEVRKLFLDRVVPPTLTTPKRENGDSVLRIVDELWKDVDWCYQETWERPARPAERRWICEDAVERLAGAN
jgi:hypothetical protein